jgi:hypothetical protein
MKKAVFAFLILALAIADAKTYSIRLFQPSVLAGTELKPGEYTLDLDRTKIVVKNGRVSVEASVKVETVDQKYAATSVRYANGDGKFQIQEIHLGGTKLKLVVD